MDGSHPPAAIRLLRRGNEIVAGKGVFSNRSVFAKSAGTESWHFMVLAGVLFALALVYQFVGLRSLLFGAGESVPIDFRLRWVESRLLIEGKDSHTWGHPDPELPPRLRWQKQLGGGYPPWATAYGLVLAPPTAWPVARTWFAALNIVALVVIAAWSYRVGAKYSSSFAMFLAAAAVACSPAAICVSYGQYAVIITAAFVCAINSLEKNHNLAAGLALGLGLVKPQLAAMVVVVTLMRRRFVAVGIAIGLVLAGSIVMWGMTGIDPLTALLESQQDAKKFSEISVNPLTEWLLPVLGFEKTTLILGFSFLLAGCVAAWLLQSGASVGVPFAIATIISMFWSYRRGYDCALLVIPMVLLFDSAARRSSIWLWTLAFAFGVSLWLPVRNNQWLWDSVQIAHLTIWTTGAIALLYCGIDRHAHTCTHSQGTTLAECAV